MKSVVPLADYFNRVVSLALLVFLAASAVGQETDPPGEDEANTRLRREYLLDLARQYSLTTPPREQAFSLTENALLFYSNPTKALGSTHGSTFLWLDGARPVAACSFSIRRPNDSVGLEFSSFFDGPLECHREGQLIWRPTTWNSAPQEVSDGPEPAARAPRRLVQMRSLARQFGSRVFDRRSGEPTELRLLPQPIYRYEDKQSGVVDGAIFGYVISNDPELLLRLEAIRLNEDTQVWKGSFARMTSREIKVVREKQEVWEVANYYDLGRANDRPYLEARAETRVGFERFQQKQQ